jgi:hypothetical protein
MPVPNNGQIMFWLKQHGYQWVLKAPGGAIVSVTDAIKQIEDQKRAMGAEPSLFAIKDVYYSPAVERTGHIWMGQYDEATGVFEFFLDYPMDREEQDGITRYTFSDGIVLVQHDGVLDTELEYKKKLQPQK